MERTAGHPGSYQELLALGRDQSAHIPASVPFVSPGFPAAGGRLGEFFPRMGSVPGWIREADGRALARYAALAHSLGASKTVSRGLLLNSPWHVCRRALAFLVQAILSGEKNRKAL